MLIGATKQNKTKQKSQQKQQNDRNAQTIQLRNHLLTFIYGGQTLGDAASFLEQNIQTRFLSGRREAVKPERVALRRLCYANVRPLIDFSFSHKRCQMSTVHLSDC